MEYIAKSEPPAEPVISSRSRSISAHSPIPDFNFNPYEESPDYDPFVIKIDDINSLVERV